MNRIILWIGLLLVVGCSDSPNEESTPEQNQDGVLDKIIYQDEMIEVDILGNADHPTHRSLGVYYKMDPFDVHLDFFIRKVPDESGDLFLYYTHPHQDFNWSARIKSPEELELQSLWWKGDRIYPPPDNDGDE